MNDGPQNRSRLWLNPKSVSRALIRPIKPILCGSHMCPMCAVRCFIWNSYKFLCHLSEQPVFRPRDETSIESVASFIVIDQYDTKHRAACLPSVPQRAALRQLMACRSMCLRSACQLFLRQRSHCCGREVTKHVSFKALDDSLVQTQETPTRGVQIDDQRDDG